MPSLYLHIPFCEKKCLYCDFYSVESPNSMTDFLSALDREISMGKPLATGVTFETIFFGGGTPSLLEPGQLESILQRLHGTFVVSPDAEVTLETNPGTVDLGKLKAYRSLGVNRLSIGVQSFNDEDLRFLSRIHDRGQAIRCVDLARQAGFANISLDMIYSLPGQGLDRWKENLSQARGLGPEHISAYSLIVEDQTPLARMVASGQITPNPAETEASLYEYTMNFLGESGFEHYEVSNYARPTFRSRHNVAYWSHENYLGFGPSAHSFWSSPGTDSGRRWWNIASIATYVDRIRGGRLPVASEERLNTRDLINERIFLGLRSDGVRLAKLEADFRFEFLRRQRDLMHQMVAEGLAVVTDGTLRLTSRGYLLCDEISERLLL
jgi:oxygen-independent coproporphyrinogen III oxidase